MLRALIFLAFFFSLTSVAALAAEQNTIGALTVPSVSPPPPMNPAAPADAWKAAAHANMTWDVTHQRPGSEPSSAYIATSGNNVYLRFDVSQRETLLAQQHANNVGDGTDDEVWIDVWPDGPSGFFYQFAATSNGTHFQYSSENTAYAPTWESHGVAYKGGFTITMRIPMRIIKGAHSNGEWHVQFVRVVRSTGERQIWSYSTAQTDGDDSTYAGVAHGLRTTAPLKPLPRLATYGLVAVGSPGAGLNTSRVGADLSIPITATSAFYATFHPDFSNVEIDQQTITPTAFQRQYVETRPFFTQGASFYDNFSCDACPGIQQLYTPAIPTPSEGYAVEGKQGQVRFAAFNAIGVDRDDAAQALGVVTKDQTINLNLQRVAANAPTYHDNTTTGGISYNDHKHVSGYFNYGNDAGSNVQLGDQAQRYDFGTYIYDNTSGVAFSTRKIGFYYNPVDGYVQHPDIAGYAAYAAKIYQFSGHSKMNSAGISFYLDRYHNFTGALNQTDNQILVDLLTQSRWDLQVTTGSSYVLLNNCLAGQGGLIDVTPVNYRFFERCQVFTPTSQSGPTITYHSGTANSPGNFPNHGYSSTPTSFTYNTGVFGPGRVDSFYRSTTMRVGSRGIFSLEVDDTRQYLNNGGTNINWLERAGFIYVLGPDQSAAIGVRRQIGVAPQLVTNAPQSCVSVEPDNIPVPCTGAWNLSFSYHNRLPHDDIYFAYGDSSQLATVPQWILKWIHYFGAEKGT